MPWYAVICRGLRFAKGGATAHIKRAGTAVRTRRPALTYVTEVAMTKAPTSLSLTQEDCEKAEPRLVDGRPKTRVLSLGNGLLLQVVPSAVDANGTYSISKQWLYRYSLDGHESGLDHSIG